MEQAKTYDSARQLALLGMLLQALHVLFGVTAIIGVLITHSKLSQAKDTVYHSQLRWQLATFWIGFVGYAVGAYAFVKYDYLWIIFGTLGWISYRLIIALISWYKRCEIRDLVSSPLTG